MGFWDRFRGIDSTDPAQRALPEPFEPFMSTGGIPVMDPGTPLHHWLGGNADADHMWRTQPSVRKVIGFAARNVASTPLHVHERVSDSERRRVTDHPLARLMSSPRPRVGAYRFWEAVISDGLLHDRWAVLKRIEPDGSMRLSRIPSWRLRFVEDALGEVDGAWFWNGDEWIELDLDELIFDYGYAPKSAGLSPVETLRDLLDETAEAVEYRRQVWANGARAPQWIKRPKDSGDWTEAQRERFVKGMREYAKNGAKAGGIPIIEDDMSLENGTRMPSSDAQDLEGRKLSAVEVASAWHIAPELIGAREGNYSNVDAYRQMLYRDSLGPYIVAWEQAINVGLTADLAEGRPLYVEANVEAKLRGSFIEQAQVMSTAIGAPWLARNEGRSMMNRAPVDGGDELVTPLNVLIGGQASPQDSGSQNLRSGERASSKGMSVRVKERASSTYEQKHREVLSQFFDRQGRVVKSRIGGSGDWWDAERWDRELSDALLGLAAMTSDEVAVKTLESAGFTPEDFDAERTRAFLRKATRDNAESINATTREQVRVALDADDADGDDPVARVFEVASESRAEQIAITAVTFASAFGAREAAHQNSGSATKTWVVTSSNPRASHAAMNGETVPLDENFSNGLPWPGGIGGDVEDTAGCQCELEINF